MDVRAAKRDDVEAVRNLFSASVAWQLERGVPTFTDFTNSFLEDEIDKGVVFVAIDGENILGTISIYESDEIIWGSDGDSALYIHRLTSARSSSRRGVGAALVKWSRKRAFDLGRRWLRVDCWANNPDLCQFYFQQGFAVVGDKETGSDPTLPAHYHHIQLRLFQMPAEWP